MRRLKNHRFLGILLLLDLALICHGLKLLARTTKSLTLFDIDAKTSNKTWEKTLVSPLSEDYPVLLTAGVQQGVGFYTLGSVLHSVNFSTAATKEIRRIGFGFEEAPSSLAYDWIDNQVYIGISGVGHENSARIEVCKLNNTTRCAIVVDVKLDYIISLTLDMLDGNMYWINGVENNIETSFLSGDHPNRNPYQGMGTEALVSINWISLHHSSKRLFFVRSDRNASSIWSCRLYQRDSCVIVAKTPAMLYFSVAEEHLIWSTTKGLLMICDINDCNSSQREVSGIADMEIFVVVDEPTQPNRTNPTPCTKSNGGCSHFCLFVQFEPWARCTCESGVRLLDDRRTCNPNGIEKALLVSSPSGLFQLSLDTDQFSPFAIPYEGAAEDREHLLKDVEYDPIEEKVYFIDGVKKILRRCNIDGSQTEDKFEVPSTIKRFRLDAIRRNIYSIDSEKSTIEVFGERSGRNRTLLAVSSASLQSISLDDINGFVYFSTCGSNGTITRMGMDGRERKLIMSVAGSCPESIDVQPSRSLIYWIDRTTASLKSVDIRNGSVKLIGQLPHKRLKDATITVSGNRIFCNSPLDRTLISIDVNDQGMMTQLSSSDSPILGPTSIKAVNLLTHSSQTHECQTNNGLCEHICTQHSNGSIACLCGVGYLLDADGRSCNEPSAFAVFVTTGEANMIVTSSLHNALDEIPLSALNLSDVASIATNLRTGVVYAIESLSNRGSIYEIRRGVANNKIISDVSLAGIHSIAIDWLSGNIYWTNTKTRQVSVADNSGQFRRTIAWKNISPTHIAVSPQHGLIFVVDDSKNVSIKAMPLHGSVEGGVSIVGDLWNVLSLTVDEEHQELYWTESRGNITRLSKIAFDGSKKVVLHAGTEQSPDLLYYYNSLLYYVSKNRSVLGVYDGKDLVEKYALASSVKGFSIMHSAPSSVSNACDAMKHACPELCLFASQGPRENCVCSDHSTFERRKCKQQDNVVIASMDNGFASLNLRRLPDKSLTYDDDPIVILPLQDISYPSSFAYDSIMKTIFFVETNREDTIRYATLVAPYKTYTLSVMSSKCAHYYSLAVDEFGRQLFASCDDHDRVGQIVVFRIQDNQSNMLRYLGSILASGPGNEIAPRDIALFPMRNLLFYVDISSRLQTNSIMQCDLSGKNCKVWYAKDVDTNTRLVADSDALRLYYTNSHEVASRDPAGATNYRHHFRSPNSTSYSVAPVDDDSVIVADRTDSGTVIWAVRPSEDVRIDMPNTTIAVKRFAAAPLQATEPCQNSKCTHMCRYDRNSKHRYQCSCPLGFAISSENSAVCVQNVRCQNWEFACEDGQSCIHAAHKCDQKHDCSDMSDEGKGLCLNVRPDYWPCVDGTDSIPRASLCDGQPDCGDGSDERHCRCPREDFDCGAFAHSNGSECVPRSHLCDGVKDCDNGMDESALLCAHRMRLNPSPGYIYFSLLGILLVAAVILLCFCCLRNHPCMGGGIQTSHYHTAETSVLLQTHSSAPVEVVEVALRTFSVADSSSSYPPLPPPCSSQSMSTPSARTHEIPPNRFYAPPPSAASLSTYGVAKPKGLHQFHHSTPRNRSQQLRQPEPPPHYSQISYGSGSAVSIDEGPQMCSTPRSYRLAAACRPLHPTRSGARSNSSGFRAPGPSRIGSSSSSSQRPPNHYHRAQHYSNPNDASSSSLSSHSSEENVRRV